MLGLAWRNLARHPLRTGLTLLGVAVTAAMLLDMVMLGGGLDRSFGELLLTRGYQIRIAPKGTMPFDSEAAITQASPLIAALRAHPEVESVGPVLGATLYGRPRGADSLVTLVAYGIDPQDQGLYRLVRGRDLQPDGTGQVVVSAEAAAALGVAVGDSVRLAGGLDPLAARTVEVHPFEVRAVVEWLYDFQGQRSAGLPLPALQRLTGTADRDPVSFVMVRVAHDGAVPGVATALTEAHPSVEVSSVTDLMRQFRDRLLYFRQLSYILGTISLVVAALLLGTLVTVTVNERLGEIAALRAIGIRRSTIVSHIVLESTALTVVGGAAGAVLGLVTARYLDTILTAFPGLPASVSFFVARPDALSVAAALLLGTGLLAGVYPAWRAARLPLASTLHEEAT